MSFKVTKEQAVELASKPDITGEFKEKVGELTRRLNINGFNYERDWGTMAFTEQQAFIEGLFLDGLSASNVDEYVASAAESCGCPDVAEELQWHSPKLIGAIEQQQVDAAKIHEGFSVLEGMIESSFVTEAGGSAERQEREFVALVNAFIQNTPQGEATLAFEHGRSIPGVIKVEKVEGLAPNGKEPYIDVNVVTRNKTYGVSMKGSSAPSIAGGGAVGIIDLLDPSEFAQLGGRMVKGLTALGFEPGDWVVVASKPLASVMNKISRVFGKRAPGKDIVYTGYADGATYSVAAGEVPPYIGNITLDVGDTVTIHSDVSDTSLSRPVPDMFVKLSQESLKTLLVGNEKMGGPVDITLMGPMDVEVKELNPTTLGIVRTSIYSADEFVAKYPDTYLRFRKRRADQPFAPDKPHSRVGKAVFDKGVFTGESSVRVVVAKTRAANSIDGGEI